MIVATEVETVATQVCPSCRIIHRVRMSIGSDRSSGAPSMVGFFGRCSNTGERVWYVITVPPLAPGMRPDRFGPIDDDEWAPETSGLFEPTSGAFDSPSPGAEIVRRPAATPKPGMVRRGRTGSTSLSPLLRLAWGCPF